MRKYRLHHDLAGALLRRPLLLHPIVFAVGATGRGAALLAQQASLGWDRKLPRKLWE